MMPVSPELLRTASLVRADYDPTEEPSSRLRRRVVTYCGVAILALAFVLSPTKTAGHLVGSGDNGELFSLTNQDRASNGIPSLSGNGTLDGIAGAAPYRVCGLTVSGRSQDMINRNYFAHPIPPCGALVFTMMQEANVGYRSAGENIGWEANSGDPASYINNQFMGSPEHRTNILDASYTTVGIGSAGGNNWTGAGQPPPGQNNVIMFAEEFAQLNGGRVSTPLPPPPPRNFAAPPPPAVAPITAPALPTPSPTPKPAILVDLGPEGPPLIWSSSGLLSDSVESVLEGYFVN
jgi:uncharacterized protein YkwD